MYKILDCTTRDGGHSNNWNFSDEYVFNLIDTLNQNGIFYYEIGYRNYYERENKGSFYYCTPDLLQKFYSKKGNLKLGIMVDTKRYSETDFISADNDFSDFVRIATHPDRIEDTLDIAERLNKKKYNIMIQLMDVTNLTEYHFNILQRWGKKNIIETLYLADTYGIMQPEQTEKYFNKLRDIGYPNISFHAHNKADKALENSLKAINLGVYSLDVTQDDTGINGGNLLYKDLLAAQIL